MISAVAVILIHVNADFYETTIKNAGLTANYIVETVINYVTRFSVPCFLLISGAFCLNSRLINDPKQFYKRRIQKILIPYLIVLLFWYIGIGVKSVVLGRGFIEYLSIVLRLDVGALWFMPMFIGCYLLAPFIGRVVIGLDRNEYRNTIIAMTLWAVVSSLTTQSSVPYNISVIVSYSTYFLIGGYVRNYGVNQSRKQLALEIIVVSVIGISLRLLCGNLYPEQWIFPAYTNFFDPLVMLFSVLVFKVFFVTKSLPNIKRLADLTFSIYLVHMLVYRALKRIVDAASFGSEIFAIVLFSILTFIGSAICAFLFDNILKKLIWRGKRL